MFLHVLVLSCITFPTEFQSHFECRRCHVRGGHFLHDRLDMNESIDAMIGKLSLISIIYSRNERRQHRCRVAGWVFGTPTTHRKSGKVEPSSTLPTISVPVCLTDRWERLRCLLIKSFHVSALPWRALLRRRLRSLRLYGNQVLDA